MANTQSTCKKEVFKNSSPLFIHASLTAGICDPGGKDQMKGWTPLAPSPYQPFLVNSHSYIFLSPSKEPLAPQKPCQNLPQGSPSTNDSRSQVISCANLRLRFCLCLISDDELKQPKHIEMPVNNNNNIDKILKAIIISFLQSSSSPRSGTWMLMCGPASKCGWANKF